MPDNAPQDATPLREEIVAILARETAIDARKFAPDTKLTDLDIASIDLVQAIFAIETRFDIEIPPGIEGEDPTVETLTQHIVDLVERRRAAAGAT